MNSRTGALFAAALIACAVPSAAFAEPASTAYYYGSVLFFASDGKTPRGKTVTLVKRVIIPDENRIVEVVLQPSREAGVSPREIVTMLRRVGTSNEFEASDGEKSFSGKLVFQGEGWKLGRWTYDVTLDEGSKLTGEGSLDDYGIKTAKTLFDSKGGNSIMIKEFIKKIDLDEYHRRRRGIMDGKES